MLKSIAAAAASCLAITAAASANSIIADEVVEFFDSGAGPIAGPYGGVSGVSAEVPVSTDNAVDGNDQTYLSLPTGSFVTVKFNDGVIVDGAGNDLFIDEVGNGQEDANVEVSQNGTDFFNVGVAFGNGTTSFDLSSVITNNNLDFVQFVKIIGLDNGGSSAGFDVSFVEGLEGSVADAPEIPLPGAFVLFGSVLGFLKLRRRG